MGGLLERDHNRTAGYERERDKRGRQEFVSKCGGVE